MKSHLFTDTQDFYQGWACPPDKICICLRMDRNFYLALCGRAASQGLSTGQYMEKTIKAWEALEASMPDAAKGPTPPAAGFSKPES